VIQCSASVFNGVDIIVISESLKVYFGVSLAMKLIYSYLKLEKCGVKMGSGQMLLSTYSREPLGSLKAGNLLTS
jgi:hypothetical protein